MNKTANAAISEVALQRSAKACTTTLARPCCLRITGTPSLVMHVLSQEPREIEEPKERLAQTFMRIKRLAYVHDQASFR